MSDTIYGFVVEPHKNGYWLVSAATQEGDKIICHDLSGYLGSWAMKDGGKFFPSVTESSVCGIALEQASKYAQEKNVSLL